MKRIWFILIPLLILCIGIVALAPWNRSNTEAQTEATSQTSHSSTNPWEVSRQTIAQISYDMSIYEVVELIGFAGEDIGSGTVVHVYQLEDGGEVQIGYRLGEGGILRVGSVSGLVPRETVAQVTLDMSIYEVVELIGFGGKDIGSGTVVHVYQLEDGGEVQIGYRLGEGGIFCVASVREVTG